MTLLLAYRRWWCIVFVALLALPTIGLFTPDLPAPMKMARAVPAKWWVRASDRLDPYINDNYGLRGVFMAAHAAYGRAMMSTRERPVVIGKNGQLFYTGEGALGQTLGEIVRLGQIRTLVNVAARMDQEMKARGGQFAMVVPPNGQTVLTDDLPDWARSVQRHPTEYDLVAKEVPARGVNFLDLRPVMGAALEEGPIYYKTDTHWDQRGALTGFNATMHALGRDDLKVDPSEALGPLGPAPTGDLARYLGESNPTGDQDYPTRYPMVWKQRPTPITGLFAPGPPNDPFTPFGYETGHPGPRVFVVGDSFTINFWQGLLAHRFGAFAWTHHRNCRFDWTAVERFKPDILIYIPVERSMPCAGTPAGLDMGAADKAEAAAR